ncbi:hypothetical protein [uncultured Campylobacter sp.]|uniref:hypothetical protein n=1 Tax=uncultured Campylobacter sp. TaxID=218934 RepID=UPI00260CD84B|nr:hypothetical protein [uncultured Campylobacter sp.]
MRAFDLNFARAARIFESNFMRAGRKPAYPRDKILSGERVLRGDEILGGGRILSDWALNVDEILSGGEILRDCEISSGSGILNLTSRGGTRRGRNFVPRSTPCDNLTRVKSFTSLMVN